MKMKSVMQKSMILILSLCLTLVMLEVGMRIVKWGLDRVRSTNNQVMYEDKNPLACEIPEECGKYDTFAEMDYNTYLGYIPRPKSSGNGYKTNSYHFRYGEDFPKEKDEDEIRIFVTGGSTAWGAGVDDRDMYTSIMEELFEDEYPNQTIRVISSGVGAYGTVQERIMIENFILQFSPDFVVMFSGWNDGYYGYFGEDILVNQDYLSYGAILNDYEAKDTIALPKYNDYSFKLHYLMDRASYQIKYGSREKVEEVIKDSSLAHEQVIQTFLKNVHIVSDLSKRFEFGFIFYLQPTIYATEKKLTLQEIDLRNYNEENYVGFPEYIRDVYSIYREILPNDAKMNQYHFIDGDFAIQYEEESVFFDHVHFGDRGNRLIANHLFVELNQILSIEHNAGIQDPTE